MHGRWGGFMRGSEGCLRGREAVRVWQVGGGRLSNADTCPRMTLPRISALLHALTADVRVEGAEAPQVHVSDGFDVRGRGMGGRACSCQGDDPAPCSSTAPAHPYQPPNRFVTTRTCPRTGCRTATDQFYNCL